MAPRPLRWAAIGLLAVSAAVHLWMFPDHAGLVAGAHAHPKDNRTTVTSLRTTPAAPTAAPVRPAPGQQAPAYTPTPAGHAPALPAAELEVLEVTAPQVRYVGWLFLAGAVALLVAIRGIRRDQLAGWRLAALTCAAMTLALGYAMTVGLPGGYTTSPDPQAWTCLTVQTLYLGLWAYRETLARRQVGGGEHDAGTRAQVAAAG